MWPVGAAERKTKIQSKIGPDLSVSREEQTEWWQVWVRPNETQVHWINAIKSPTQTRGKIHGHHKHTPGWLHRDRHSGSGPQVECHGFCLYEVQICMSSMWLTERRSCTCAVQLTSDGGVRLVYFHFYTHLKPHFSYCLVRHLYLNLHTVAWDSEWHRMNRVI